jgi:hypothetical protein
MGTTRDERERIEERQDQREQPERSGNRAIRAPLFLLTQASVDFRSPLQFVFVIEAMSTG